MTDIITWVSFTLQLWSIGWPFQGQIRDQRIETGEFEVNLGFFRYRSSWVRGRDTLR